MSPSSPTAKPTIAFFGATGLCALETATLALKNGYHCTALARTPSKLTEMLLSKGVPKETISANLVITRGDVKDIQAVTAALQHDGVVADLIVSGIGMILGRNADSKVCREAARIIIAALRELDPPNKPCMLAISTTGLTDKARDVPIAFTLLYHVLLKAAHEDKRAMENLIVEAARDKMFAAFIVTRASLLMNGAARGRDKVRVGTEMKPAVGYTIRRADVGQFIFDDFVMEAGQKWRNQKLTLTF